jgi:hypothetical protein
VLTAGERPGMNRQYLTAACLLILVVLASFWLNTRVPSGMPLPRAPAAGVARPVMLCTICGKPVIGAGMVRKFADGTRDLIHPGCYRPAKGDPPANVAK